MADMLTSGKGIFPQADGNHESMLSVVECAFAEWKMKPSDETSANLQSAINQAILSRCIVLVEVIEERIDNSEGLPELRFFGYQNPSDEGRYGFRAFGLGRRHRSLLVDTVKFSAMTPIGLFTILYEYHENVGKPGNPQIIEQKEVFMFTPDNVIRLTVVNPTTDELMLLSNELPSEIDDDIYSDEEQRLMAVFRNPRLLKE